MAEDGVKRKFMLRARAHAPPDALPAAERLPPVHASSGALPLETNGEALPAAAPCAGVPQVAGCAMAACSAGSSTYRARRSSRRENIENWVARQKEVKPEGGLHLMMLESLQIHPNAKVKIHPSTFEVLSNELHHITIKGPPELIARFRSVLGHEEPTSVLSPTSPINLSNEDAVKAGFPEGVRYFAYLHPVRELEQLNEAQIARLMTVDAHVEQEMSVLRMGGFVYLDQKGTLLRINAITADGGIGELCFEGPAPVNPMALARLRQQERLRPVTLKALREAGAVEFAWVNPQEFGAKLGPLRADFGAFAYTGGRVDGKETEAIYFAVSVSRNQPVNDQCPDKGIKTSFHNLKKRKTVSAITSSALRSTSRHLALLAPTSSQHFFVACVNGEQSRIQQLLDLDGELLHERDENGLTGLMHAVKFGRRALANFLVERGAELLARDEKNLTAIDLALDRPESDPHELVERLHTAIDLLLSIFPTSAGATLSYAVAVVHIATMQAHRLKAVATERSEELLRCSERAQSVAAALVETLSPAQLTSLLATKCGKQAIRDAVQAGCKVLLGRSVLQRSLQQQWRGKLIDQLMSGTVYHPTGLPYVMATRNYLRLAVLTVGIVLPFNVLLLPLVTVCPPLGQLVQHHWLRKLGRFKRDSAMEWHGFDEKLELYLPSAFILDTPFIKFALYVSFSTGLAVSLTNVSLVERGDNWLITLWVITSLVSELQEWRVNGSAWYFTNVLNPVEIATVSLLAGTELIWVSGAEVPYIEECESFGIVLLWLAVVLRGLSLTTSLGPLVLMFMYMVADAAKWLTLMIAVIIAFAAGFLSLFNHLVHRRLPDDGSGIWEEGRLLEQHGIDHIDDDDECGDTAALLGSSIWSNMRALMLIGLEAGDEKLSVQCLAKSEHPFAGQMLLTIYLLTAVVVLLNMLIAMMAKSFEKVWEAQAQNYQYIFAMTVVEWEALPTAPPPLSLLNLPYKLLTLLARSCSSRSEDGYDQMDKDLNLHESNDGANSAYKWDESEWALMWSPAALKKHVEEFCVAHLKEVTPTERMCESLEHKVDALQKQLSSLAPELYAQHPRAYGAGRVKPVRHDDVDTSIGNEQARFFQTWEAKLDVKLDILRQTLLQQLEASPRPGHRIILEVENPLAFHRVQAVATARS
ncbi:hypothetical protein AB1Y20_016098 [Prymnesium parvum]|uniref:Ion transport domain-containing protein n=1 Tax=Prymnesium parvum TaxID=97485 RepID=A0AB34K2T1_PRYPA